MNFPRFYAGIYKQHIVKDAWHRFMTLTLCNKPAASRHLFNQLMTFQSRKRLNFTAFDDLCDVDRFSLCVSRRNGSTSEASRGRSAEKGARVFPRRPRPAERRLGIGQEEGESEQVETQTPLGCPDPEPRKGRNIPHTVSGSPSSPSRTRKTLFIFIDDAIPCTAGLP